MPAETGALIDWLYLSPDGRQLLVTLAGGPVYVYQIYARFAGMRWP